MSTQPNKLSHPISGVFGQIKLDFSPEFDEPLEIEERFTHKANYPTTLAYLHIYLDNQEVSQNVSSAYLLFLMDHLLAAIPMVLEGKEATAEWVSDPWQLDLVGLPATNQLQMTLRLSQRIPVLDRVKVPLDQFCQSVIELAYRWGEYLGESYPEEIHDSQKGKAYQRFTAHLNTAKAAMQKLGLV